MTLHVCTAYDRDYVVAARAMLGSLKAARGEGKRTVVHVLDGTGAEKQTHVSDGRPLESDGFEVRLYKVPTRRVASAPVSGHVSAATYFRLLLGEVLPVAIRRILYLDADTLVLRDPASLIEETLLSRARPIAAASDPISFPLVNASLLGCTEYFNAGVLLVDMRHWRTQRIGERALAFVRQNGDDVVFWDQDGLNHVLAGSWVPLDPRWNVLPYAFCRDWVVPDEIRDAAREPWIVHFSSDDKPWMAGNRHPFRSEFQCFHDSYEITFS